MSHACIMSIAFFLCLVPVFVRLSAQLEVAVVRNILAITLRVSVSIKYVVKLM